MKPDEIYKEGTIMGNNGIVFLQETTSILLKNGVRERQANFKCYCGKIFNTAIVRVKNNRARSCGCYKLQLFIDNHTSHGRSGDPIYSVWKHIRERTRNKNHRQYKHYGERGITMFPPWQVDFQLFYDYVSALPHFREVGRSLDRANNDGNYEPGNLRWATRHVQNANRRPNNSTGYLGVYKASVHSWSFSVGKDIFYGFHSLESAINARNRYITENNLSEYLLNELKK